MFSIILQERYMDNREQKRRVHHLETRPRTLFRHLQELFRSRWLKDKVESMAEDAAGVMRRQEMQATGYRDATLALLLVTSGGTRGASLLNMTIEEW